MTFYTLKAAPAASAVELKNNNKSTKAKRILVGCDVHLRGYQAARKIDDGAIGVVDNFRSEEALLLYIEKQRQQAEQVVVGLRSRTVRLHALSQAEGDRGAVLRLCAR